MSSNDIHHPVLLIIRDGWGERAEKDYNAVALANTPTSHMLSANYPRTLLHASGLAVGLPKDVQGNSEVGHQNIGAGRIMDQAIVSISKALQTGAMEANPTLHRLFTHVKSKGSALHLMGLLSEGGIHSSFEHLLGLLKLVKKAGLSKVWIHAFLDGRDTPPKSGLDYVKHLEAVLKTLNVGAISTICGRFYAMDRDKRWERTQKVYDCLTGKACSFKGHSATAILKHYYENPSTPSQVGDEFVPPSWIVDKEDRPLAFIGPGDGVLCFNFRGDRPRQLCQSFLHPERVPFNHTVPKELFFATLTDYEAGLCSNVVIPRSPPSKNTLGEVVSRAGLKQFRCAETEKYPHVTFFFNDYREAPFEGEERVLVDSPREVLTYDLKPEMSAEAITKATIEAIESGRYPLLVVNFANADMVGHTGILPSAIQGVETVDQCLSKLIPAVNKAKAFMLVTADHGNAECMWDSVVNAPHKNHTCNLVEAILYHHDRKLLPEKLKPSGKLADIAPTVLKLLQLPQPIEMTGESLF